MGLYSDGNPRFFLIELIEHLVKTYKKRKQQKMQRTQSKTIFRPRESNPNQTYIGERIRHFREVRNLSLIELSELTGINKNSLNHYESGVVANPPYDKLLQILKAMNLTWADILPPIK
jgi:DNA-binding transcriptional regulator YiaG